MNIESNTYLSQVKKAVESNDSHGRFEAFKKSVNYENGLREVFVKDPKSPLINDGYFNVYDNFDVFSHKYELTDEEREMSVLCECDCHNGVGSAIVNRENFIRNFDIFTGYQLKLMDWSNVFVAGGATLAAFNANSCGI